MKFSPVRSLSISVCCLLLSSSALGQGQCLVTVNLVNHNRYAYKTEEECDGPFHSVPWGNWGVSSNVGSKHDTDQFKGWDRDCSNIKVQWNSCSVNNRYRTPAYLNFPLPNSDVPLPANGYPFSDSWYWNDTVPPHGFTYQVDQHSPCGPNTYGGLLLRIPVPAMVDYDNDGIADDGGCKILDGKTLTIKQNFMTVYELDEPDEDDLIQSLFYPDLTVRLSCTPYNCVAVGDQDRDGLADDLSDPRSPAWQWPVLYQDGHGATCKPDDAGVPCKRIDATIRIGYVYGLYSGPLQSARRGRDATPPVSPARSPTGRSVLSALSAPFAFTRLIDLFVEPPRRGRVTGRVIERETGSPLAAEIGIAIYNEQGITLGHLKVAEDGWFETDDLPPGDLCFSTKVEGFAAELQRIALGEGEAKHIEFQLIRTSRVRGLVASQTGEPAAGARVRIINVAPSQPDAFTARWQWETDEVTTDDSGGFVIAVHPEKEFVIEASRAALPAAVSEQMSAREEQPFIRLSLDTGAGINRKAADRIRKRK